MKSGIYCIEKIDNGKKYVGKGKNLIDRMNSTHINCTYIYNAIKKYGKKAFKRYIIEYCEPEEMLEREQYYINLWDTLSPNGYNLTKGGEGTLGYVHTPSARNKMSDANRKENNPNWGKTMPEYQKIAIKEALTGRIVSLETREKISVAKSGWCMPIETKEKISYTTKGTIKPMEVIVKMKRSAQRRKLPNASSSFIGVEKRYLKNGKVFWIARVYFDGKKYHAGSFKTELDAARAYDRYVIDHNIDRPLNFPEDYK